MNYILNLLNKRYAKCKCNNRATYRCKIYTLSNDFQDPIFIDYPNLTTYCSNIRKINGQYRHNMRACKKCIKSEDMGIFTHYPNGWFEDHHFIITRPIEYENAMLQ